MKKADDEEDDDIRVLKTMKSNYGRLGQETRLKWTDGVFVNMDQPVSGVVAAIARRNGDEVFLTLLGELAAQGRNVAENPHARNYAPRMFTKHPNRQGFTKKDFEFSMERGCPEPAAIPPSLGVSRVLARRRPRPHDEAVRREARVCQPRSMSRSG